MLEGYSSTILQYMVPYTNNNGLTNAVYMTVEPDQPYQPINLYFSLSS